MRKRTTLSAVKVAAEVKNSGATDAKKTVLASIRMPKRTFDLIRSTALARAAAGARFSVSRVVVDLAEKYRDELERESRP
jgi:hypothetical protein